MLSLLVAAALAASVMTDPPPDTVATWQDLDAAGTPLRALVVRPSDEPDRPRPVLLAFPPGGQDEAMAENGVELYWQAAAEAGWIVVSPEAPADGLWFAAGADAIGGLLDALDGALPIEGRVHVAGPSNGGRSAFRAAFDHAHRIASLTVLPGFPEESDLEHAHLLAGMPVAMYVGGGDRDWRLRMEATRDALGDAGVEIATYRAFDGEGHVPPSLTPAMLVERLASFAQRERARLAVVAEVDAVLDDFHAAASEADFERYFDHFTADGVFIGTDATERWTVPEFRAYAAPVFETGTGWTYTPLERHVSVGPLGRTAWFDERLSNEKYGETRGSGVLVRTGPRWRIAQYVLSFPVPNDVAPEVVERIAEHLDGER